MRTDDPVILKRLQEIEAACAGLRMACGFPPLNPTPETTASRKPHWCGMCGIGYLSAADLDHHVLTDHATEGAA